jgi:hypothetical protein
MLNIKEQAEVYKLELLIGYHKSFSVPLIYMNNIN